MKTTLNEIRNSTPKPCPDSWEKLLESLGKTAPDGDPVELTYILDTLGLSDTHWVLCVAMRRSDVSIKFAAKCASHVLPIFEKAHPNDSRPRLAIEAALDPSMSTKDKRDAASAAYSASAASASAAAAYSAYAAASSYADASAAASSYASADAYVADAASDAAEVASDAADIADAASKNEREWQLKTFRKLLETGQ